MIPTPVLIIGGGPVGLTLALCLSQQGTRSIIVNERTATTTHPKLDASAMPAIRAMPTSFRRSPPPPVVRSTR